MKALCCFREPESQARPQEWWEFLDCKIVLFWFALCIYPHFETVSICSSSWPGARVDHQGLDLRAVVLVLIAVFSGHHREWFQNIVFWKKELNRLGDIVTGKGDCLLKKEPQRGGAGSGSGHQCTASAFPRSQHASLLPQAHTLFCGISASFRVALCPCSSVLSVLCVWIVYVLDFFF